MTQQQLNGANIGPGLEQVNCERVPTMPHVEVLAANEGRFSYTNAA